MLGESILDEKPGGRGVGEGCETGQDDCIGAALKEDVGCIGAAFQDVELGKVFDVFIGGSGCDERL